MLGPPPHPGSGLGEWAGPRFSGLSLIGETEFCTQTCRSNSTAGISRQPDWCTRSYNASKQLMTIAPDLLGMGAPHRLPLRDIIVVSPPAIPLDPGGVGMSAQPCGSRRRQDIVGRPQGFGHAGETVQRADGSEHMRGVGALTTSGAQ
jgi:hypothetical protein